MKVVDSFIFLVEFRSQNLIWRITIMKKVIALLVSITMLVLLMAGCGTNSTSSSSGSKDSSSQAAETQAAPADDKAKDFTLKIIGNDNGSDGIDVATKIFQKTYPNAKVDFITGPWGNGGADTRNKELIMISSGDEPDIGKMCWGKEFFSEGVIMDLTDAIKSFDIYPKLSKGQLERMTYNDKIFGVTYGNNCVYLFYNKDILAQAGIAEPPKTLDELAADAKIIKDKGLKAANGKPVYALNFEGGNWANDYFLWANGGKQMADDYSKTLIDSPESIKAFQWMQDCVKNGYAPKPDGSYDQLWLNGQLAFWHCGEWDIKGSNDAKLNYGLTTMPKGVNGDSAVSVGGVEWAIFKSSKLQKEAIDFLKVLVSPEMTKGFDRAVTDLSSYDDPELQAIWKQAGTLDGKMVQKEQLKSTKFNFLENPYSFPDAAKIYADSMDKILVRGDAVEPTMKAAAEAINKGIAESSK
jgi:ABC-type glycerol-3-phosphate transport system substrate-binding protein